MIAALRKLFTDEVGASEFLIKDTKCDSLHKCSAEIDKYRWLIARVSFSNYKYGILITHRINIRIINAIKKLKYGIANYLFKIKSLQGFSNRRSSKEYCNNQRPN